MAVKWPGGHQTSVICIEAGSGGAVFSGAEEGELTQWSAEGNVVRKTKFKDIGDVTSIVASKQNPNVVYISCGVNVFCYDIRDWEKAVRELKVNEEEINQLKLNEQETYLTACDDAGLVKVVNVHDWRVHKTLRKHTNIVSSACFRPQRPWDLVTAGFDCNLIQWDFSKARAYCTIDMNDFGETRENVTSYLVSPPFVHNMDISSDGNTVACATENAHVKLFKSNKRTLAFSCNLTGHASSVSQVHFPKMTGCQHTLISAGNDAQLFLWDLTELNNSVASPANGSASNGSDNGMSVQQIMDSDCSPKHVINHGTKINYVTSAAANEQNLIYVADCSTDISVYPFSHIKHDPVEQSIFEI